MEILVLSILILNLVVIAVVLFKVNNIKINEVKEAVSKLENVSKDNADFLKKDIVSMGETIRNMFREQRLEVNENFKQLTDSTTNKLVDISGIQRNQLESFSKSINEFTSVINSSLTSIKELFDINSKQLREEIASSLKNITETNAKIMGELGQNQKSQLEAIANNVFQLTNQMNTNFDALKNSVVERLDKIRDDNTKQLEQIRATVDEKLQGTLEKRLGDSFKLVSERLEQVYKGLGEMQNLANGVGDLKRVLSNVKTRGIWGEIQLEQMLEQVFTPDQYDKNVAIKNANEKVEFAIKLPNKNDDGCGFIYLPIDAKFPLEDYQKMLDAYEVGDNNVADLASKQLDSKIRAFAKDIFDKYINPPKTTDFAILYLPVEGLFAEIVRKPGLMETLRKDCKVIVAGPTTLWAIFNSLQMGFRTLAIQKKSNVVWDLLSAVKTEWSRYGELLKKVKEKLDQASNTIDDAKKRSELIGKKLKDVEQISYDKAMEILEMKNMTVEE